MKKYLSIIMVFVALTNIVGFYPLYFSAMQFIKSEVSLNLSTPSQLMQVEVWAAEYNNSAVFTLAEENEFNFKGKKYDYQSFQKTTGGYIFYAVEDTKESNLVDLLTAAYGQANTNNNHPFNNLLKNFSKDFVGSFSKRVVLSLTNVVAYPSLTAPPASNSGYAGLIPDPPDKSC